MEINLRALRVRQREIRRTLGDDLRAFRLDAGLSQAVVAREAGISQGHLSGLESGDSEASLEVLLRIGAVLGLDPSVKLFPNTGPFLRDRHQVAMTQALLKALSGRWRVSPEVPVYRPARGVIDAVLEDRGHSASVATELHSQLRRVEQQVRWHHAKADALAELPEQQGRRVSRLLVLRNTAAMREVARAASELLTSSYPATSAAAVAALTGEAPWPGDAVVWMNLELGAATLLDGPPRGVPIGRLDHRR
jgi:transcriptional regulator with XRE-family HTH domain